MKYFLAKIPMACSKHRDAQYILVVADSEVEAKAKVDAMPNRVPYIRNRAMKMMEVNMSDQGTAILTTIIS